MDPASLYASPNALAPHYARFRVSERLLLTGHSHQAWPDCGFDGHQAAWLDAAHYVDDKWEHAFVQAERVRDGFARLLGDAGGGIALGANTHELVVRLLSALPLKTRPRLLTTDGEFHSIRRQLDRLEEEGLTVVRVPEAPLESLASRISRAVDDRTALVSVSAVFFDTGRIAHGLAEVAASCHHHGSTLLVDAYHALNVVPISLANEGLGDAFIVGGGYKYCQLGEGNCFLRIPRDTHLRPVVTGWFSEFTVLEDRQRAERVAYGGGGDQFAGATYDPTSHYRAVRVFEFFRQRGLTPTLLREVSQHQIELLASTFDALDLDPAVLTRDRKCPIRDIGGFLALRSRVAVSLARSLRGRGVWADARGEVLRLGPAPYLSDRQLRDAMALLGEVSRENAS
ncbi:MAG TPA: aminotransferase class V-fold PLP-dependent enzyme [Gemmatimonadales bacterium]|nr:aminotransferase class V-fold PLP-dependent enzyme [Gemmatimonadales bacterium]